VQQSISERIPKSVLWGGAILAPLFLILFAYAQPGYFTNPTYLAGLVFLEFIVAAVWFYRLAFFPLVIVAFVFAGTGMAVGGGWTVARWVVLAVGGAVGCAIILKERGIRFGAFHMIALFAIFAGLVSAAESRYPGFALLKALSALLLFVYAGTGVRVAVTGHEPRFFAGLLIGCELFVAVVAISYLRGQEVMGNPNSLGAVMGVACAPILLWGTLLDDKPSIHYRRLALYAICMYLVFHSHARAGIGAALVSCALMCLALHKYKLFLQGSGIILILATATALVQPHAFSEMISTVSTSVVYKSEDPTRGLLASRESPWETAVESISANFWFGTGFGTTGSSENASARLDQFSTTQGVTAENGSSYLAIVAWVGMLGMLPFLVLLLAIMGKIVRTLIWMSRTGSPSHPAIPLAMVMVAGLLHAGFEDWLFAPGYYLCVFFWSLAFVLVDLAPRSPLPSFLSSFRRPWLMRGGVAGVAPRP
jgi:O-antigen ligase